MIDDSAAPSNVCCEPTTPAAASAAAAAAGSSAAAPLHPESLRQLERIRRSRPLGDLWVFAYASLIWKPECAHIESRPALVRGWHRSLCMKSTINRGTPQLPGLVFALDRGGACRGVALRIAESRADQELLRLWSREMVSAVYTPHWVRCLTPKGSVTALTFTLPRSHPSYLGRLPDAHLLDIFKRAAGRYGSTWEYVRETHQALQRMQVHDAALARVVRLAQAAGLR
jgi:cation transport protein ChaC